MLHFQILINLKNIFFINFYLKKKFLLNLKFEISKIFIIIFNLKNVHTIWHFKLNVDALW